MFMNSIVYLYKISVLKVLLLITELLLSIFAFFMELLDKALDLTTDVLIYGKFTSIRSEL